jgi:hypothetical protein
MLVASRALPHASAIFPGNALAYWEDQYRQIVQEMDVSKYADQRVVIKGCSSRTVPPGAYTELVLKLQPVVRSLMFGEPCSTVPVYKSRS